MGLPIRPSKEEQLEPREIEHIWPLDDAVDLGASDLITWCREGGSAGLVLRDDGRPCRFVTGPLGDRAFRRVMKKLWTNDVDFADEAFRFGFIRVEGPKGETPAVHRGDVRGLYGVTEGSLDWLGHMYRMKLYRDLADVAMWRDAPTEGDEDVKKAIDDEEGKEEEPVAVETALPHILGYHVIRHTFRSRRRHA